MEKYEFDSGDFDFNPDDIVWSDDKLSSPAENKLKLTKYLELDETCIKRAQQGSAVAFHALHKRYRHRIYGFVRIRIRDKESANDITNTVFVKAFQKLNSLKAPNKFCPWLFSIARNEIKMYFRDKGVEPNKTVLMSELEYDLPSTNQQDNPVTNSVRETLNKLKPVEYEILYYYFILELDYAEIAKLTGKSEVALTGKSVGPPLFETIELLGKETVIERLNNIISKT